MKRRDWLTMSAGLAAAAVGGSLGWWHWRKPAEVADDPLWSLVLDTPDGRPLKLADYRGQPLLVNFWATWCAPCVREMPQIDRFAREFRPRGWQVLGIAVDNGPKVASFLKDLKIGFPSGIAGFAGVELSRALGNAQGGLPFTVAFDSKGRLTHRKIGETSFDELAGWARSTA